MGVYGSGEYSECTKGEGMSNRAITQIERFEKGSQSVTLAKALDTFEVSWFITVERAGMLATVDEDHARRAYNELMSEIKLP